MSLGSRILRRGRTVLTTSTVPCSTPRDPLLFLYPTTWISTIATAQTTPAIDTGGEQDARIPRYPSPSSKHSRCADSQNDVRKPSIGEKDMLDGFDPPSSTTCTNVELKTHKEATVSTRRVTVLKKPMAPKSSGNQRPALVSPAARGTLYTEEVNRSLFQVPQESERDISEEEFRRAAARVKDGGLVRRVLSSMNKRFARQAHHARVRESLQIWDWKGRGLSVGDWRKILQRLKYYTPRQAKDGLVRAMRVLVPVHFAKKLFFDSDGTIWNIETRHTCQVTLNKEPAKDRRYRVILLSGSATGIAGAAAELAILAPGSISEKNRLHTLSEDTVTPLSRVETCLHPKSSRSSLIRFVGASEYRDKAPPIRGDMVFRPSSWTVISFARYVEHLTRIHLTSHTHKLLYKRGEIHQEIVMDLLRSIFLDPECEAAISTSAFNDAVAYLMRHSFVPVAYTLYSHMDKIGLTLNTDTYNIMLRHAAKTRNLYRFDIFLQKMTSSGYRPNEKTWVAFLMTLEPPQFKLHVIAEMKRKNLFHDLYIRKAACEQLVSHEIEFALEREIPQDEFLEHMTYRYGPGWMTIASANRIIAALASRGLFSRCWELMQFIQAEGIKIDAILIATVLHHCDNYSNYDGVMELIRRIHSINAFVPGESLYACLFQLAWKTCRYATARVIWAYACLDVATSFQMRMQVRKSALNAFNCVNGISSPAGTMSISALWKSTAGPFILGHRLLSTLKLSSLLEVKRELLESRSNVGVNEYIYVLSYEALVAGQELLIEGHHLLFENQNVTNEWRNRLREPGNHSFDQISQHLPLGVSSQPIRNDEAPSEATQHAPPLAPEAISADELIHNTITKHSKISRKWVPSRPFPELLLEAWEVDKKWKASGGFKAPNFGTRLQWLSATAPKIPLEYRTKYS